MTQDIPVWHNALGDALAGAKVIIRVRAAKKDGTIEDVQMWGIVASARKQEGIEVALEGARKGETYWVPPDHRSVRKAKPGKYRLEPSGEEVDNPDFIFAWLVRKGVSAGDTPLAGATPDAE